MEGKVKWFSARKGYGFITDQNGNDLFVHYSNIQSDGFKTLNEGETVRYEIKTGDKGKDEAVNVTVIPA